MELATARYSLRRYSPRPIARDVLERCLEAARLAPSACNSQPWSFVVVDQPAAARQLAEAAFSGLYRMNRFAGEAPVLIAVVTQKSLLPAMLAGQFRGVQYSLLDVGAACEHLVLQAAEEGVGSCWLGWFNEKAVKRFLALPATAKVDVMLSLGYPAAAAAAPPAKNRKSLEALRRYHPAG